MKQIDVFQCVTEIGGEVDISSLDTMNEYFHSLGKPQKEARVTRTRKVNLCFPMLIIFNELKITVNYIILIVLFLNIAFVFSFYSPMTVTHPIITVRPLNITESDWL